MIDRVERDNVLADALSMIYEEREASADMILVEPTKQKAIKGQHSAMTSSVKHNLHLAHTVDPVKEHSFFCPTPLDPFSIPNINQCRTLKMSPSVTIFFSPGKTCSR